MCPHEEKLTAWLLGDLPPDEQDGMTRHLDACASCRALRDDLERVVVPLRSALSKDQKAQIGEQPPHFAPSAAKRFPRSPFRAFVERAALAAVSFGAFFGLLSLVYQSASRRVVPPPESLTHIEFRKASDEPAATPLQFIPTPAATPPAAAPAAAAFDREIERGNTEIAMPNRPVPYPQPPPPELISPPLRRLRETALAEKAETVALTPALSASSATATGVATPTRERPRTETAAARPSNLDIRTKPIFLSGEGLATTNPSVTNTVHATTGTRLPTPPSLP